MTVYRTTAMYVPMKVSTFTARDLLRDGTLTRTWLFFNAPSLISRVTSEIKILSFLCFNSPPQISATIVEKISNKAISSVSNVRLGALQIYRTSGLRTSLTETFVRRDGD